MSSNYKGLLLVVSSPSGAGKTTLCRRLRAEFPQLQFSVSYTTRAPRPGETHGVEYFFVDRDGFTEMVARDEFAEYALVHGNNYGTSAPLVREALAAGTDLLFDIDFQGGRQLRSKFPEDVVLVFILTFGDFVSPLYLGGGDPPTLSILITDTTKSGQQWPRAAVVALVMIATLLAIAFAAVRFAYRERGR